MKLLAALFATLTLAFAPAAGAAADFDLRLLSSDATTDTIGWDAQPGDGYRFYADGTAVSRTFDPARTSVRFAKAAKYGVTILHVSEGESGEYPPVAPPPPPPPPPLPPAGTTITLTDAQWRCTTPILQQAVGGLPLRVILNYTKQFPEPGGSGAAFLANGCDGDSNEATVDIIFDIRGDGRTFGPGGDAIRLANNVPGPQNLVISGTVNCGPRYGAAHQDGVQVLSGRNVIFRDMEIGNYDAGIATCQGAGGVFFYSGDSTNVDVQGGKFIGCNHGLLAGWASPGANVTDAKFRTGGAGVCAQTETFVVSQPCDIRSAWGGVATGLTCEQWNGTRWVPQT